ncbi:DUF3891 family protein [Mucilaginibacter sp. Bleaf8]|uniref:DUF3891 family protein n=1 Tax=Mucilaginibacter sp. Bleaf8 TaxID=2834430 RepID=UPI001BCE52D6|nr:DUF3891 family protein [Mucilaginibacter sp. Bleaf8]MBS7563914.1 DUF3891 family protein [Mucilaginibacter sp. Bleaf8]
MIVNYTEQGWEIITQRAHGLLAGQFMLHWAAKQRPKRWMETLLAVAEHDDARIELEADDLLTPQGGPLHFAMRSFDAEHCRRVGDFALSKSRYIALLHSMHMDFLYRDEAKESKEVKAYLAGQTKLQKYLRKGLNLNQQEADKLYALLEWCDALSLLLCQHKVQPEERGIDISRGPAKSEHQLRQMANGALTVTPWPFEDDAFEVQIESRLLTQLHFKTNDEFKKAFLAAEVQELTWQFTKQ